MTINEIKFEMTRANNLYNSCVRMGLPESANGYQAEYIRLRQMLQQRQDGGTDRRNNIYERPEKVEVETYTVEEVAWSTWNDAGYSKYSKTHLWNADTEKTLCGIRIPEEGDGIVIDEFNDGKCQKCQRAFRKHDHVEMDPDHNH